MLADGRPIFQSIPEQETSSETPAQQPDPQLPIETGDEVATGGKTKAIPERVPPLEARFSIPFHLGNGSETVGSISLLGDSIPGRVTMSTERPGGGLLISLGGMMGGAGGSSARIGTAQGSEVRFGGVVKLFDVGTLSAEDGERVVFYKDRDTWDYVCGVGKYEEVGKTTSLGAARTVNSCLALLTGGDPILREGAARDLGRLATASTADKIVEALIPNLGSPIESLQRSAIEGLGVVGTADAETALRAALLRNTDKTTEEFLHEALGFCAA